MRAYAPELRVADMMGNRRAEHPLRNALIRPQVRSGGVAHVMRRAAACCDRVARNWRGVVWQPVIARRWLVRSVASKVFGLQAHWPDIVSRKPRGYSPSRSSALYIYLMLCLRMRRLALIAIDLERAPVYHSIVPSTLRRPATDHHRRVRVNLLCSRRFRVRLTARNALAI